MVGLENMYQIISKKSGIKLLIFYNLCSGVTEMINSCMLRVSLLTKNRILFTEISKDIIMEAYLGHQEKIINLPGQDNYLARAR